MSEKVIILDDMLFDWQSNVLADIAESWEKGEELEDITKRLRIRQDNMFLAIFHLWREGAITRPFAYRRKTN